MKLNLIAVAVLRHPVPDPSQQTAGAHRLLTLANAWLQRRAAGFLDDLVLVGVGFTDMDEIRASVTPFGLGAATILRLLATDDGDFGEDVGAELHQLLPERHPCAISVSRWPVPARSAGYPEGLWWMGIECSDPDSGRWADSLSALLDEPFRSQAPTWEALLSSLMDLDLEGDSARLQAGLSIASFARWLHGFNAAAENTFFDFDYRHAADACDLDDFLLGFEAAIHHGENLVHEADGHDTEQLRRYAVRALLGSNRYLDTAAIRSCFGGSAALFFSLHTSIWPNRSQPACDVCSELCSPTGDDIPDRLQAWSFVDRDDWSEIDDSA